jgi:HK97 gp10 family phage protein
MMVTTTRVRVDGLRQIGENMRKLSADVAGRVSRQGVNAGATLIKKAAKIKIRTNPSVETGSLEGAVITKKLPSWQTPLTVEYIVTVRGRGKPYNKKGKKIDRAPHASKIEFGTVNMPAEPFLRPAFEAEKRHAVDAIADKLRQRIAKVSA